MLFKAKYIVLIYVLLVSYLPSQAQDYADKNYYLIDSLNLSDLVENEKELIHTSLTKFHNTNSQSLKLKAINTIVENSWDDVLWPKYNQWMFDYTKRELGQALPVTNIENLNVGEKLLLKYYANALNNIGIIYNTEGKLPTALAYYYESLSFRELINDSLGLAEAYNNIGNIYAMQDDIEKALEFSEKSLIISKLINSEEHSTTLSNLGSLYRKQGNREKALFYYKESLKLNKKLNNVVGVANSLSLIGLIYETEGGFDKSLNYLLKNIIVLEENGYQDGVIGTLTNIARIYSKKEVLDKARNYGERAIVLAKTQGDPELISIASDVLSSIYQKENNWKKAFEMEMLHFKMQDSIQNTEIETSLIKQASEYELDKKQQEIELLSVKNEVQELKLIRNETSILLISGGLLFALMLAFAAYRGYKKKLFINRLLERQKAEISRKNDDKKIMLQEIHHRVKNNLQVVNSLLRMQSSKTSDKGLVSAFKETQSRVLSMAKLHEKMYQSGDLKRLNAKTHITMLVEEIVKNYTIEKEIILNLDIEELFIDAQTMMPLSLIINEIITNSLKYAFVGMEKGTISVKLGPSKDITKQLYLADDGIGYIKEESSTGLGSKLIQSFTRQLNGTIEKISDNGTVFKLTFENIIS